jgi:hypothetical protein
MAGDLDRHGRTESMRRKQKPQKSPAAKPNKSAFVRSLAFDLPSAEVIARAKAKGMRLTRNDVHAIRAIARRKHKQPKPSGANSRSSGGSGVNKSAFVRSLPSTLSAAEVIARGKAKGIRLSAAQVYTIRANARRKRPKLAERPRGNNKAPLTAASVGADSREAEFIAAALDLGLTKAEGLIHALRSKAVAAVS